MKNRDAYVQLCDCWQEINEIKKIIERNPTSFESNLITRYALIKVCGTIERVYKNIISDYACISACDRTKNYIDREIRNTSKNPQIDNMYALLERFDSQWNKNFKKAINRDQNKDRILYSIKSLNALRNDFAHGKNIQASFNDVLSYYRDSCKIIYFFDKVVS